MLVVHNYEQQLGDMNALSRLTCHAYDFAFVVPQHVG